MKKYNHLFKIPNDSEGKAFVSTLKKYMKDSDSIHTLRVKGRNPYVGYKAYNGSSDGYVRLNEAENVAVYLKEDTNSANFLVTVLCKLNLVKPEAFGLNDECY